MLLLHGLPGITLLYYGNGDTEHACIQGLCSVLEVSLILSIKVPALAPSKRCGTRHSWTLSLLQLSHLISGAKQSDLLSLCANKGKCSILP